MSRKSSKTPQQIAAELQARANRVLARAAQTQAETNPQLAKLADVRDSFAKEINVLSRKLKGPNSFESRLRSVDLRKAWIEAESAMVNAEDTFLREARKYLDSAMMAVAERISKGETIEDREIADILDSIPQPAHLADLRIACHTAEQIWRDFTATTKAQKSETQVESESAENASGD